MRYLDSSTVMNVFKTGCRQAFRFFSNAKPWEKLVCCLVIAILLALSLSAEIDSFFDTFFMVFAYNNWIAFILPMLLKKITLTLFYDFAFVTGLLLCSDIIIFGVYRKLRRIYSGSEVVFDSTEQHGYIFLMNCVRLLVVVYCLCQSYPTFVRRLRGRQKTKKQPNSSTIWSAVFNTIRWIKRD